MRKFSKFGVVVAAAVGTAFLAGCAGQGGGTTCGSTAPTCAEPAPMPVVQNTCKGMASCKGQVSHKKKHHKASKVTKTTETTETTSGASDNGKSGN